MMAIVSLLNAHRLVSYFWDSFMELSVLWKRDR